VNILAYALGFSAGNALGLVIEQRLALGNATVTLISRFCGQALAERLRADNFPLTTMTGEGRDGPVHICMAVLPRKAAEQAVRAAREVDPDVVVTIEDVRHTTANSTRFTPQKAPKFQPAPSTTPTPRAAALRRLWLKPRVLRLRRPERRRSA
jgi:hypothetical protein